LILDVDCGVGQCIMILEYIVKRIVGANSLASVQKYKNRELLFRASLAQDRTQVLELTCAY
jgi:hypothetical protein